MLQMPNKSQILRDDEIFATTALALFLDQFGTDALEWDPNAIQMEITDAFNIEASDTLMDRLLAAITVLTSNTVFVDVNSFMMICNSLNRGVLLSNSWVPADLDDVLWGVTEMRMLLGDDFDDKDFSHDIKRYVGILLQQQGIKKVPSVLRFAEFSEDMDEIYDAYGGDAIMEQAFWDSQQKEKDSLEIENQDILSQYMAQLSALPIKSEWLDSLKNEVGVKS